MLNMEDVLKLIDKGFTHDEIMAFGNQTEPEPKADPKTEPEPKADPKTEPEPQADPKTEPEPKQDVTGQDILNAILALGKQVQSTQAMGQRLPELKDLTPDEVVAQLIRPRGSEQND